jgi:2-polyprenyl-6-methoxyphenol hydroxylase-like FAD-dependent oxidoreductase
MPRGMSGTAGPTRPIATRPIATQPRACDCAPQSGGAAEGAAHLWFHGISYHDDERRCATATFRSGAGRGVRTTALHGALLNAAEAAGVKVVQGNVVEVSQDAMSVRCNGFRARYLAAADGLHSPIRTALGLAVPTNSQRRWGIRRHVQVAPWSDNVEVHWPRDEEAYVTPVSDDCVGVTILTSRRGRFDQHLETFPALVERVDGHAHGRDVAAGPLRQKLRSRVAGRVLLVGAARHGAPCGALADRAGRSAAARSLHGSRQRARQVAPAELGGRIRTMGILIS